MNTPRLAGSRKQAAPDAAGSTAVVAEKPKAEVVTIDGHVMGSDASKAELAAVEKAEGYKEGDLEKARAAGHIRAFWHYVAVSNGASPTGKGASKAYVRFEARNVNGMSAICKGQMNPAPDAEEGKPKPQVGACDYFNYGSDLDRKAPVRQQIMRSLEGPEKAVKKAVIGAMAGGFEGDELRNFIRNAPKFKGVEGLDKLIEAAIASAS